MDIAVKEFNHARSRAKNFSGAWIRRAGKLLLKFKKSITIDSTYHRTFAKSRIGADEGAIPYAFRSSLLASTRLINFFTSAFSKGKSLTTLPRLGRFSANYERK